MNKLHFGRVQAVHQIAIEVLILFVLAASVKVTIDFDLLGSISIWQ
jgi:hypothetical protein